MRERCGIRRDVAREGGATQDVRCFDRHEVWRGGFMIDEYGPGPVAVRTTVDECCDHRGRIDDGDHRRS